MRFYYSVLFLPLIFSIHAMEYQPDTSINSASQSSEQKEDTRPYHQKIRDVLTHIDQQGVEANIEALDKLLNERAQKLENEFLPESPERPSMQQISLVHVGLAHSSPFSSPRRNIHPTPASSPTVSDDSCIQNFTPDILKITVPPNPLTEILPEDNYSVLGRAIIQNSPIELTKHILSRMIKEGINIYTHDCFKISSPAWITTDYSIMGTPFELATNAQHLEVLELLFNGMQSIEFAQEFGDTLEAQGSSIQEFLEQLFSRKVKNDFLQNQRLNIFKRLLALCPYILDLQFTVKFLDQSSTIGILEYIWYMYAHGFIAENTKIELTNILQEKFGNNLIKKAITHGRIKEIVYLLSSHLYNLDELVACTYADFKHTFIQIKNLWAANYKQFTVDLRYNPVSLNKFSKHEIILHVLAKHGANIYYAAPESVIMLLGMSLGANYNYAIDLDKALEQHHKDHPDTCPILWALKHQNLRFADILAAHGQKIRLQNNLLLPGFVNGLTIWVTNNTQFGLDAIRWIIGHIYKVYDFKTAAQNFELFDVKTQKLLQNTAFEVKDKDFLLFVHEYIKQWRYQ